MAVTWLAGSTPVWAQSPRRVGLVMGYPAALGVLWQVTDSVAVRPDVTLNRSTTETTSTTTVIGGTQTATTTSDGWTTSVGLSGLLYLGPSQDDLRFYLVPRAAYVWSSTNVESSPMLVDDVNPSIPFWGGPVGIDTDGTAAGETVYSYGNSSLRGGVEQLSPKQGTSLGTGGDGWTHPVYTVTPGVPGDSGSAFLSSSGQAMGVLSTLQIAPLAGGNGVGDLAHELAYARAHVPALAGLQLALGTVAFNGSRIPGLG
jgi:hypothetical protein